MNPCSKVFILTMIASFVVFRNVHTSIVNNFTVDQYKGVWYTLGIMSPIYNPARNIRCYSININKIHDRNFHQNINLIIDEIPVTVEGYGNIVNSEIRVYFKHVNDTSVYKVASYNHGEELILHDEIHPLSYRLISRGISMLPETKAEFEKLFKKSHVEPVYLSFNNCSQHE